MAKLLLILTKDIREKVMSPTAVITVRINFERAMDNDETLVWANPGNWSLSLTHSLI